MLRLLSYGYTLWDNDLSDRIHWDSTHRITTFGITPFGITIREESGYKMAIFPEGHGIVKEARLLADYIDDAGAGTSHLGTGIAP